MTPAQISLLERCIRADRIYRTKIAQNIGASMDERGVEIGWINGVNPRTADALAEAGLIDVVNIHGRGNSYAFLGKYEPYEELESWQKL